jgi:tetratricopeptide (TPR) repeat protein
MNAEIPTPRDRKQSLIDRIEAAVNRDAECLPLDDAAAHLEYRTAMDLCEHIGTDEKNLTELEEDTELFILDWAIELPFRLARAGLIEEAATLGARFAAITEAQNFLPDRAIILAEAGRREDALAQVTENLQRFAEDPWVTIKSGDVYETLAEREQAERLYRQGLEMAGDDEYTRAGAVERLVPLVDNAGRKEEANAHIEAEEARKARHPPFWNRVLDEEPGAHTCPLLGDITKDLFPEPDNFDSFSVPYTRPDPKIGRNDPCPCGSAKKYKKCCLGK